MRPVHAASVGGSHTSNLISESALGLAVPCTRQKGTETAAPPMVAGGVIESAAVIVAESDVTARRALQSTAWAPPENANAQPNDTAAVRKTHRAVRATLCFVLIDSLLGCRIDVRGVGAG